MTGIVIYLIVVLICLVGLLGMGDMLPWDKDE